MLKNWMLICKFTITTWPLKSVFISHPFVTGNNCGEQGKYYYIRSVIQNIVLKTH